MAFTIPEALPPEASKSEQKMFALLRRHLPSDCVIWHRTALELDFEEQVPFLVMGSEVGIVMLSPLDWQASDVAAVAGFWQHPETLSYTDARNGELQVAEQRCAALHQLLLDSGLPRLVDGAGLRVAMHRVYVFMNFNGRDVTAMKLRSLADGALVFGQDEINQIYAILCQLTPQHTQLSPSAFDSARLIMSPGIEIPLRVRHQPSAAIAGTLHLPADGNGTDYHPLTLDLQQEQMIKSFAYIPPEHQTTARDLDTRLVRGVVGSGKSLILIHRAKFLSQLYPQWRVLLLTYNRPLTDFLSGRLNDLPGQSGNIEITNFHAWCRQYLVHVKWPSGFLNDWQCEGRVAELMADASSSVANLDPAYVVEEIDWIRDQKLGSWEKYAGIDRRGRGKPLMETARRDVYEILEKYRKSLYQQDIWDWTEVPLAMSWAIDAEKIAGQAYDAVLVDEAQDFAPSWFAAIQKMLKPQTNMLFLVADAAQKIYRRSLSWRTLGIDVTGNRSRVLKRSYRNTFEIMRVAYDVIGKDNNMKEALQAEGDDIIEPDMDAGRMRHGPMPVILSFGDAQREYEFVAKELRKLKESGLDWNEIAIIHRDLRTLYDLAKYLGSLNIPAQVVKGPHINLASPDVKLLTLHSSKGLEFSAVFIAGVERLAPQPGLTAEELQVAMDEERRLLYVGLTRARDLLYISHTGPLPIWVAAALTLAEKPG